MQPMQYDVVDPRYQKLVDILNSDQEFMDSWMLMNSRTTSVLEPVKMYILYTAARSCMHLEGDIAELGVFKGGTAVMLCELGSGKRKYLYDTFCGLPEDELCDCTHSKGGFSADIGFITNAVVPHYEDVIIKKGTFPDTFEESDRQFCFVHLDCDLYKSIKSGLECFYPRLVSGGIIVIDDAACPDCPLAHKAVVEFCDTIPEKPISTGSTQMFLIKR